MIPHREPSGYKTRQKPRNKRHGMAPERAMRTRRIVTYQW